MYYVFNGRDLPGVSGLKVLTACWNATHDQQEAHTGNGRSIVAWCQNSLLRSFGNSAAPSVLFQGFGSVSGFASAVRPPGQNCPFCVVIVVGLLSEKDVILHRVMACFLALDAVACGHLYYSFGRFQYDIYTVFPKCFWHLVAKQDSCLFF